MRRTLILCFGAAAAMLASGSPTFAAERPFVGTWKLNPAKSQFTGDTMQFTALRGGRIRFAAGGQSYTFKADGKAYYGSLRRKVAWTRADDGSWRAVWTLRKKVVATETIEIAPGGTSLKDTWKATKADGTPFEDTAVYERVAGAGTALVGTWRSTKVDLGGLQTVSIAPHRDDGIVLTMVDFKSSCTARLDGQDYAYKGPTTPPGLTFSFLPRNERELHVVQKQNGFPLATGTMAVEEDGRSLTWTWTAVSVKEPMKAVFDRQ